jgi:tetratricopeptide (TPR) repeat protein
MSRSSLGSKERRVHERGREAPVCTERGVKMRFGVCAAELALRMAILLWLPAAIGPLAWAISQFPDEPQGRAEPHVGAEAEADAALASASTLIEQGRLAEAEAALRTYLAAHNASAKAHSLLGLVTYQENRPADSLAEFTRAAQLKRPRASELVIVALDYVKLRDLANADKWLSVATEMAPASAGAWRYLGGIKYSENRFSEAIRAYEKCLQLQPEDVLAEDGLGRSYEGLTRDEDAEAAYRKALDWQSHAATKHAQPLLHMGILMLRQGQPEAAIPYLEAAEALDSGDKEVHKQLGEGYSRLKQWPKAEAELERAIELSPNDSHLHWLAASVYRREGQMEKAEREYRAFSTLLGSHSNDKEP